MASILDLFKSAGANSPNDFLMRQFAQDPLDEEEDYDPAAPIDVYGSIPQGQPMPQPAPQMSTAPAQPRQMRDFDEDFGSEYAPKEHKGRFGTKGVLRDILGTLGDAFLVQGGADAMYAPQREKEKAADAMAGFSRNPLKAIERLARDGFVEEAQKMYEKQQVNALGMDRLAFDQDKFKDQEPDRQALRAGRDATRQRTVLGNARAAIASVSTPQQWAALRPRLQAQLKEQGLDIQADLIPEDYNPDVQYLFMDPKDLAQLEDRDALRNQQAAIARLRVDAQKRGQDLSYSLGKQRNATGERNAETARRRQEQAGASKKKSFNFGPPPPGIPKPPGGAGVRPR